MGYDPMGLWTFSIGINFSAYFIAGSAATYSLAFDDGFNVVIQKSKADFNDKGGVIGLANADVSVSFGFTEFETVYDLEGKGMNVTIGNVDAIVNTNGGKPIGVALSTSLVQIPGVSLAVTESYTETTFSISDSIKAWWDKTSEKLTTIWESLFGGG